MLVLTWNLFHGRSVPDAPRELLRRVRRARSPAGSGTSRCCRRCRRGGRRRSGARAGASARTALTSRNWLLPRRALGRAAPPRPHQVLGRRRQRDPRARRGGRRAPRCARCARGPSGAWCTACAWSAAGGSATCTPRRTPRRARRPTSRCAAATAIAWAAGAPVVLGGDLNTRAPAGARASTHAAGHSVDHVFARRLRAGGPGRTLDRGRLSDHAPVLARALPRKDRPEEAS